MKRLTILVLAVLVIAAAMGLAVVGCGEEETTTTAAPAETTTSAAASGGTIKIGALLDFTGPVAELGPIFQMGIEAALEEANYTVAGKKVELIIEDSATSVDTAVAKAKKLVEQDGVKIIIGPLMGDAHLALSPYCAEKGVIITSLINGMWDTVKDKTYLIYPTTVDAQTYPFGTYCFEKLGYKKAVVVHADYAGKAGYAAGWIDGFKAAGGEVLQVIPTPVGSPDYAAFITSMQDADADVVMYALEGPGAVSKFIYQYNQAGKKLPLVTITQADDYSPQMLQEVGELVEGIKGQSSYTWKLDNPLNKTFVELIKAKWDGLPPMPEHQNSYTLTKVILAGLEATGGDDSKDVLWDAIVGMEMDTAAGPLAWEPNGIAITNMYVTTAEKVGDGYEISAPLDTVDAIRDPRVTE
jgi:branched-chain amino acid transport system substrate-binding protein